MNNKMLAKKCWICCNSDSATAEPSQPNPTVQGKGDEHVLRFFERLSGMASRGSSIAMEPLNSRSAASSSRDSARSLRVTNTSSSNSREHARWRRLRDMQANGHGSSRATSPLRSASSSTLVYEADPVAQGEDERQRLISDSQQPGRSPSDGLERSAEQEGHFDQGWQHVKASTPTRNSGKQPTRESWVRRWLMPGHKPGHARTIPFYPSRRSL